VFADGVKTGDAPVVVFVPFVQVYVRAPPPVREVGLLAHTIVGVAIAKTEGN
jgi:hypothetical protein